MERLKTQKHWHSNAIEHFMCKRWCGNIKVYSSHSWEWIRHNICSLALWTERNGCTYRKKITIIELMYPDEAMRNENRQSAGGLAFPVSFSKSKSLFFLFCKLHAAKCCFPDGILPISNSNQPFKSYQSDSARISLICKFFGVQFFSFLEFRWTISNWNVIHCFCWGMLLIFFSSFFFTHSRTTSSSVFSYFLCERHFLVSLSYLWCWSHKLSALSLFLFNQLA